MALTTGAHDADQFRVLHWNIHSWRDTARASNRSAVAELVDETAPQVVSLVEVDESWGMPDSLNELADRLGYSWLFTPSFEFGDHAPNGGFGNALLVKLPILAAHQWQLLWPPRSYDGTEHSEGRSVVAAKLRFAGISVWVGTTHLPRGDARERAVALQRLTAFAERLDGLWLLCGDFNTPSSSWIGEGDQLSVCPHPPQSTYPAQHPTEPIDYCVASAGLDVTGEVLQVDGSDHLPLLTTVRPLELMPGNDVKA